MSEKKEKVLITGTAGFIGFHTARRFLEEGYSVVGLDNINDYYDVNLKLGRLKESGIETKGQFEYGKLYSSLKHDHYRFTRMSLEDYESLKSLFEKEKFDRVVHLAAQAGVRYSLTHPFTYADCNLNGHLNILEACRHNNIKHLVYASSSSVYGSNTKMPLSTSDNVDHPISLYAATKKANELMSHTYSHLYHIPTTGLRFFTVYGPWGRPDMALFIFTKAILEDKSIDVYNHGDMWRDFTYIDDIVEGVFRVTFQSRALKIPPIIQTEPGLKDEPLSMGDRGTGTPDPSTSTAPYKIYNIGNSSPVKLMDFIEAIEKKIGTNARKNLMEIQPGDVPRTWADTTDLEEDTGYKPDTPIAEGVAKFVEWYRGYYRE